MEVNWKGPTEFIGRWLKLRVSEKKGWHMGLAARELDSGLSPAMKLLCNCASHFISLYCSFHVFKIGTGVFAAHCSSPPANKTWCIRANWAGRHRSFSQESCVLEQQQTVRTGQNRDTLFFEGLQIAPVPFITDHCRWALMRSPSCLCNIKYNLWYSPRAASPWERKAGFSML